jgi:uncharacterized protein (TIRG00374 family)
MTRKLKKRLTTVFQWGLPILAFWYVARKVSWDEILNLFVDTDPILLPAIAVITTLQLITASYLWWVLLRKTENTLFWTTLRIDLIIKFINHIIPSKAAGHSIAPLVVKHYTNIEWTNAVTVSVLNTGLYAMLYGLVSLCGLLIFMTRLPSRVSIVILLATGIYAGVGVLVLLAGYRVDFAGIPFGRIEHLVADIPQIGSRLPELAGELPSFTEESSILFRNLVSRPDVVILYSLAWVGTLVVFPGARVAVLISVLGGSFTPLWLLPVALVMAYSVTVLPLTPGGIGVAEASATLVLVSLGVSHEIAVVVVLVDRVFGAYIPALLGAVPAAGFDLTTFIANEQ